MVTNTNAAKEPGAVDGVRHRTERILGRRLHWVEAGTTGSPILLVHGFPETWWVFHRLVPLLARTHRVVAVDLPGFGDSAGEGGDVSSAAASAVLHALVERLALGPVHLSCQDISGGTGFRFAVEHPDDVRSLIAIETLVPGFGFERLADVAHGGAWHIGAIATPGVAEFVFADRMHEFLASMWFPLMTRVPRAVTEEDLVELVRAYSLPGAWAGPRGLYASALHDGDELVARASAGDLRVPVLAVDGMGSATTAEGMRAVSDRVTAVLLADVGHHVALEAPERLAEALLGFMRDIDPAV